MSSSNEMYPVRISSPWPGRRYVWRLTGALVSAALLAATAWLTLQSLAPLQQHYFNSYFTSTYSVTKKVRAYQLLSIYHNGAPWIAIDDQVRTQGGEFSLLASAADAGDQLGWATASMTPAAYADLLQRTIYHGLSTLQLFRWCLGELLFGFPVLLVGGAIADQKYLRDLRNGHVRRGPRLLSSAGFNEALAPADGIWIDTVRWRKFALPFRSKWFLERIAVPAILEVDHFLVNGDTGTGKSQLFLQFLRQIQARRETAIVYDPTGEFTAEFYNEERGDIILNPFDQRCAFWTPGAELKTNAEALTIAEALFPDTHADNQFFVQTPRQIFAHLLQYAPTAQTLADWMANPDEIDRRVEGTELAHIISKGAPQQREGVLATLSLVAQSLRLLPPNAEGRKLWTALDWAKQRKGWIFLRTVSTTRKAQIPLVSMWLDMLILRLMDKSTVPVWLIIDELASLRVLPQLKTAATELRKYNIRIVLGLQARSQLQSLYGDKDAQTIMQMAQTKVFFRLNDADASDWASRSIGDQEIEHLKTSGHQGANPFAKRSYQFVAEIRTQKAVVKEQIQGLKNRHGYIVHGDAVHAFELPIFPVSHNVPGLIEREGLNFVALGDPGELTIKQEPTKTGDSRRAQPDLPAATITPSIAPPYEIRIECGAVPKPATPTQAGAATLVPATTPAAAVADTPGADSTPGLASAAPMPAADGDRAPDVTTQADQPAVHSPITTPAAAPQPPPAAAVTEKPRKRPPLPPVLQGLQF